PRQSEHLAGGHRGTIRTASHGRHAARGGGAGVGALLSAVSGAGLPLVGCGGRPRLHGTGLPDPGEGETVRAPPSARLPSAASRRHPPAPGRASTPPRVDVPAPALGLLMVVGRSDVGTGRTDHRPDAVESWSWWGSCAVITGLAGVAITQPMLDLFGRSPEFFVSGRYTPRQIVAFALIVAFVPPVVASVAIGIGRLLHASIGRALHVLVVFGLAALFALGTMSLAGVAALAPAVVVAVAVGVAVAWIERRVRPVRTFLSYLALGNLVFVALFLFASQTAPLIAGRTSAGAAAGLVDVPSPRGPVVFIIFD